MIQMLCILDFLRDLFFSEIDVSELLKGLIFIKSRLLKCKISTENIYS